jgi:hypothetical protein
VLNNEDEDLGFGWPTFTPPPTNPVWKNAYKTGDPAAVLADILPSTGIFAPDPNVLEWNTNLDLAGIPTGLAHANHSLKTLGVWLGSAGSGYIAGDVI